MCGLCDFVEWGKSCEEFGPPAIPITGLWFVRVIRDAGFIITSAQCWPNIEHSPRWLLLQLLSQSLIFKLSRRNRRSDTRTFHLRVIDLHTSCSHLTTRQGNGGRLNIKMHSYQHRNSHYEDNTISQPSYLYNTNGLILKRGPWYQRRQLNACQAICLVCCVMSGSLQHPNQQGLLTINSYLLAVIPASLHRVACRRARRFRLSMGRI